MALIEMVPLEEELRRNPELRRSDIEMLRSWCEKQPHLPKITDSELVLFLHSNYYRLEPTKSTIDTFYTARTHIPELFSNRDPLGPKELRLALNVVTYILLPKTTAEGYKIIYGKLIDTDPSHYVYTDVMKFLCMMMDLWQFTEGTNQGQIILIDMEGASFGHAGRLSPSALKKFLFYLQEALPVRLKGFHFMNTPPFMDVFLGMMKPFMKKELINMLVLHTNLESLSKHIPVEALPNEQGGKAGSLKDLHEASLKNLQDHRAWFIEEEIVSRVNESLRPGEAKNATDLFGVEGSFKKLDID